MEPVLPDAPVEESEFDLDVRLQPVARHVGAGPAREGAAPSQEQSCWDTCTCQAGCQYTQQQGCQG
jgi:hypothetical protein